MSTVSDRWKIFDIFKYDFGDRNTFWINMDETNNPRELYKTVMYRFSTYLCDSIQSRRGEERRMYLDRAAGALSDLRPIAETMDSSYASHFSPHTGFLKEVEDLERKLLKMKSRDRAPMRQ